MNLNAIKTAAAQLVAIGNSIKTAAEGAESIADNAEMRSMLEAIVVDGIEHAQAIVLATTEMLFNATEHADEGSVFAQGELDSKIEVEQPEELLEKEETL